MSKKNRPTDSGGNWMDTYGDMVTLLLTFFIMLYSMSNLNAEKWSVFVKSIPSIQNQGSENITINSQMSDTPEVDSKGQEIGQEALQTEDVNKLYLTIAESLNQADVKDATVIRGDDYTYVSFANSVFFGANSSVLTLEGQKVLYSFAKAIAPAAGGIEQVNIMSHTAKVTDNSQINPQIIRKDRILSAMRSAEACIYLQKQGVIDPKKLVDISYGEYRPIADNSTEEGRIKNRRIEFLLLDNGAKERNLDEYYKDFKSGEYTDTTVVTVGQSQSSSQDGETVPADAGTVDTGAEDAGTVEAGAEDTDAGTVEAGAEDAGTAADTGPVEEMQNTSE
mgnify:CR=1 FL=1